MAEELGNSSYLFGLIRISLAMRSFTFVLSMCPEVHARFDTRWGFVVFDQLNEVKRKRAIGKGQLTINIIPRVRVGYELAVIISYPTNASGIIVLLKTPTEYREFFTTLFVKSTDFPLVVNFEQTRTVNHI